MTLLIRGEEEGNVISATGTSLSAKFSPNQKTIVQNGRAGFTLVKNVQPERK
jgi:hypothetical protein